MSSHWKKFVRESARVALAALACTAFAVPASLAQGGFVNFEMHPFHGLELATVGESTYLLACVPHDNAVFVVDTATLAIVKRVPVGLEPVSVRWMPSLGRFYVANFVGDSVSMVEMTTDASGLHVNLLTTRAVGDEPADLALGPGGASLLVSLNSSSAVASLDPATLDLQVKFWATFPLLTDNGTQPSAPVAMKEPRAILTDGTRMHLLAAKGGADLSAYEFDLISFDFSPPLGTPPDTQIAGLGSLNTAMTRGVDGNLYIASNSARNTVIGKDLLKTELTGFVQSHLFVMPSAVPPGQLFHPSFIKDRDLNLDAAGQVVSSSQSVSMPTAVALLESGGLVQKVFLTSFQTDRIVELTVVPGADPSTWPNAVIDICAPSFNPTFGPRLAGPRCLAMKNGTQPRLYCLNSLDSSISVYDPTVAPSSGCTQLGRVQLPHRYAADIDAGRRFLYDARKSTDPASSTHGVVACASCHADGKSDSLAWRLDAVAPGPGPIQIPPFRIDGVTGALIENPPGSGAFFFPADRGVMVTQSLQGLVDHPMTSDGQAFFTNAPYHWRGDKPGLPNFNEAFVNLQGAPDLNTAPGHPPEDAFALTDPEMALFTNAINSIMYPPNPREPWERVYTGSIGDAAVPAQWNDENFGSGALRGMKLFHVKRLLRNTCTPQGNALAAAACAGRSCVQCHSLPSGGNTRIVLTDSLGPGGAQPMEAAALRGLISREGRLVTTPTPFLNVSPLPAVRPQTLLSGLSHTGVPGLDGPTGGGFPGLAINDFISEFFADTFVPVANISCSGSQNPAELQKLTDVIDFVRQMDWGIAPSVGRVVTIDALHATSTDLDKMEAQARLANCGVAVYLRQPSSETGLWYSVQLSTPLAPLYQIEGSSGTMSRSTILGLAAQSQSMAVFAAVPAGSERRVASLTGAPTLLSGPAPGSVALEPMAAPTQWTEIGKLSKNWVPGPETNPDAFFWNGGVVPTPISLQAQRIFQDKLLNATPQFGITAKKHEPPRRFRVTGDNFRIGAKLRVTMSSDPAAKPPNVNPLKLVTIEMPIFPTDRRGLLTTKKVWETTVEAAPTVQFVLLNGGPWAPDVLSVYAGLIAEMGTNALDPAGWNLFDVRVVNEDGTASGSGNWQSLKVK